MSERQTSDDNNNTGVLELSRFDLREVHTKKKARRSNKPHQSNNPTLDEYFSSSIMDEEPQQEQVQRLLQYCNTMTSSIQEQKQKNDEILSILHCLESKINENYLLHNKEQAEGSKDRDIRDAGEQN